MSFASAESIGEALLYEGYLLYPYRASSVKNRQRWTFGGVYPEAHCLAQTGNDAQFMQTECLVCGGDDAFIDVRVRFLHLTETEDSSAPSGASTWQEAEPRQVVAEALRIRDLLSAPRVQPFSYPGVRPTSGTSGTSQPGPTRRQERIEGTLRIAAVPAGAETIKLTVRIENGTELDAGLVTMRDEVLLRTLVSTHTVLGVRDGEFISMLDPPDRLRVAVAECKSVNTWPVLVGEEGQCDAMLSSPVILYDYPRIAPESPGDLFDGTEIDEILTLRVLTLTDEEKRDVRALDGRARAMLERTEGLGPEALARLHGAMRRDAPAVPVAEEVAPWSALEAQQKPARFHAGGVELGPGDHVRLAPRGRADVMDLALAGKTATIVGIEQDYDGQVLFAVTVDDDPGSDLGLRGHPGHRFFFRPEEIEPAPVAPAAQRSRIEHSGPPRILVAGIGNIFLGDDGFGSELARRLMARSWPEGVRVADFGIRGFDLTYALLDGYDAAILLDVVRRGGAPGTLYVIEPDAPAVGPPEIDGVDTHGMHPVRVLGLVRTMGGQLGKLRLVACEPATFGDAEEMAMGLSAAVEAALAPAAEMVASLVMELRGACAHA